MAEIVISQYGAQISITNTSTEKVIDSNSEGYIISTKIINDNGHISPSLTMIKSTPIVVPAFVVKVPSFVTYKCNSINPGDTVSFVVTKPDEILYYLDMSKDSINDISVTVQELSKPTPNLQDVNVTPSLEAQTITCDEGYDGIGTVRVSAVTSSIDENIVAENIKKDVEILGVTGSYEGSGGGGGNAEVISNDDAFYFEDCLVSIEIPDGITSIGTCGWYYPDEATGTPFYNYTNLESITIPNSVTSIGDYAFYDCYNLDITSIGNRVISIGNGAFSDCSSLTNLTLPVTLQSIGAGAFSDCQNLESIRIYDAVTEIGSSAFSNCSSLEYINIPNNVTEINDSLFSNCIRLHVLPMDTSPNSVITTIGSNAFTNCRSLGYDSVMGNMPIDIPNSVEWIGSGAFEECISITTVNLPNNIPTIEDYTFNGCTNLTSITIPNSVASIGYSAFNGCTSITSIMIPNGVANIGSSAFAYCSNAISLEISDSVTKIGDDAFKGCANLTSVEFLPITPPELQDSTFGGLPTECIIYIPNGTLSVYTSASNYPDPTIYTYIERPAS